MTRPLALLVNLVLAVAVSSPALGGKNETSPAQLEGRLEAVYGKAQRNGTPVGVAYALLGVSGMVEKGKLSVGQRGIVVREGDRMLRIRSRGGRITITRRTGPSGDRNVTHVRDEFQLLGGGLALNTVTSAKGKQSQVQNYVEWKNSSAYLARPLTAEQLGTLRRLLDSPVNKLAARGRALADWLKLKVKFPRHTSRQELGRSIPAAELERALKRMGLAASVDWR
jgi:hypothetical protein